MAVEVFDNAISPGTTTLLDEPLAQGDSIAQVGGPASLKLQAGQFRALLFNPVTGDAEIVLVTGGHDTAQWQISRGMEDTTPKDFPRNSIVKHIFTRDAILNLVNGVAIDDGPLFSVSAEGAVGDFGPDDSDAFLSAIGKAMLSGGIPYVPAGHYKLTKQLLITQSNVEIRTAPGAILDFSTANIGSPNNWVPAINFVGSDGPHIALTNDVASGDQFVRVAAGSEPTDGAWIRLASNAYWSGGTTNAPAPPIDSPGLSEKKGEHRQVVMPTGSLSVQLNPADTSLTISNVASDARVGARWPVNASVRIGAEDIAYTTVAVGTNTVVLGGLVRGGGATTHLVNSGVALTPGYVGLRAPTDDSYAVADGAWINTETLLEKVGITGSGEIIGPGFGKGANAVNFDRCTRILSSPNLTYKYWDRASVYLSDVVETDYWSPNIKGGNSNSSEFYGVAPQWGTQDVTVFGGEVEDVRHAFTTTGSASSTGRSGVCRRIVVDSMHGINTTSNTFDTHPDGEDIEFLTCISKNSAAQGFNMRCPSAKIIGGSVKDAAAYGVRLRNESFKPTRYVLDGGLTIERSGLNGLMIAPDGQYTTLRSVINIGDIPPFDITVDATGPWTTGAPLQIGAEWFSWTFKDGTHFTITARAQNGSAAAAHAIGDQVLNGFHNTGANIDYIDIDNVVVQGSGVSTSSASVNIYSADTFAYRNVHIGKLIIKDQVGSGSAALLMQNVQNSSVERVIILNHPTTANGVDLQNCVDVTVRGRVEYTSRSTGIAFRLRSSWPWGPATSNCTVEFPRSVNAGTGINVDSTCSACRLRGLEGIGEATTRVVDAGNSVLDAGAGRAEQARDYGFITWAYPPEQVQSNTPLAVAGTAYLIRVTVPWTQPVRNIVAYVGTAGAGLVAGQCFAALYSVVAGTAPLGVSADQAAAWASTGTKSMTITGSPITVPAGDYWVVLWFNGTTGPGFDRGVSQSVIQSGGSGLRWAVANTGLLATPPASLSGITGTGANSSYWAALT